MKRSDAQIKVKELKELFNSAGLLHTDVTLKFDRHEDNTRINDIILDKVTGFKLPLPGTNKPSIFTIQCDSCNLTFLVEHTQTFAILNGVRLCIGTTSVDVRKQ